MEDDCKTEIQEFGAAPAGEGLPEDAGLWAATFDALSDGVSIHDADFTIRKVNRALCRILDQPAEKLVGRKCYEVFHRTDRPVASCPFALSIGSRQQESSEIFEPTLGKWLAISASPMLDSSGRIGRFVHVVRDITARKKAAEELQKSEQHFRSLFDNMLDGFAFCRMLFEQGRPVDFIYLEVNQAFARLTGLQNVVGRKVSEVLPGLQQMHPELFELYGRVSRGGKPERLELHIEGLGIWLSIAAFSIRPEYFTAVFDNITERKQAEARILAALSEKEALLKEVHHRVKNNLQIVYSLLRLQTAQTNDETVRTVFNETQNRIRSIASVHELLYQSNDLSRIDFASYVQNFVAHLFSSYGAEEGRITFLLDCGCPGAGVTIQQAIPLGLIINELVSNSLKYAFPGDSRGEIRIGIRPASDGSLLITVADNGTGVPGGLDLTHTTTLGMQLVMTLVGQLRGTIAFENQPGLKTSLAVPNGVLPC